MLQTAQQGALPVIHSFEFSSTSRRHQWRAAAPTHYFTIPPANNVQLLLPNILCKPHGRLNISNGKGSTHQITHNMVLFSLYLRRLLCSRAAWLCGARTSLLSIMQRAF
jgi:hypothetical protein